MEQYFLRITLIVIIFLPNVVYSTTNVVVLGLSNDRAMLEINGKARTLKPGQTSPEGVKLISADSESAVLEVEGQKNTYELSGRISTGTAPNSKPSRLQLYPDKRGMYVVTGSINNYPTDFIIDTGANMVALNSVKAKQIGIHYQEGLLGNAKTASGIVPSYKVTLDKVQVGGFIVRKVEAIVIEGTFPQEVLLGMSFLKNVDMQRKDILLELLPRE